MSVAIGPLQPAEEEDVFEDMVETDQESTAVAKPVELPSIQLSFDNSKGGAWDDRELIRAYDTAIEEFHVHHPGPGSWLDKATAALAKGEPLPGASSHGTAWYSASYVEDTPSASSSPPPKKRKTNEPKAASSSQPQVLRKVPPSINPYAPIASTSRSNVAPQLDRASPSYAPPSPPVSGPQANGQLEDQDEYYDNHVDEEEEDDEEDARYAEVADWEAEQAANEGYQSPEEWYDESCTLPLPESGPSERSRPQQQQQTTAASIPPQAIAGPSNGYGVQSTDVSTSDAFSLAMTAQYWAGYWMGVAQSKSAVPTPVTQVAVQGSRAPGASSSTTIVPSRNGAGSGQRSRKRRVELVEETGREANNVFITKKQFHRPSTKSLRR